MYRTQLNIRRCAQSVIGHRRTRLANLLQPSTSLGPFGTPFTWESQAAYHCLAIKMGGRINLAQDIPWTTEVCTSQQPACNWFVLFTVCKPCWRREATCMVFEEHYTQRLQGCRVQGFRLVQENVWLTYVLTDQITVFWSQTRWVCACIPLITDLRSSLLLYCVVLLHTIHTWMIYIWIWCMMQDKQPHGTIDIGCVLCFGNSRCDSESVRYRPVFTTSITKNQPYQQARDVIAIVSLLPV